MKEAFVLLIGVVLLTFILVTSIFQGDTEDVIGGGGVSCSSHKFHLGANLGAND